MQTILITGGSGLIGGRLTEQLLQKNYSVSHLSRNKKSIAGVKTYRWNIAEKFIDEEAILSADHIIHLTGTSIAGHRWTKKYKQEIVSSRIDSTNLLFAYLSKNKNHVQSFISASAIGYYGNRGDEAVNENSASGNDFLSDVCMQWEQATSKIADLGKRTAQIRTGIVLAKNGGALPELIKPIRFGIAPVFGNGQQWNSWIHIDDLCCLYIDAIENEKYKNAINAVAPNPVRFENLIEKIKGKTGHRAIKICMPSFFLHLILGEMADMLRASAFVKPEKAIENNFTFHFTELDMALDNLLT